MEQDSNWVAVKSRNKYIKAYERQFALECIPGKYENAEEYVHRFKWARRFMNVLEGSPIALSRSEIRKGMIYTLDKKLLDKLIKYLIGFELIKEYKAHSRRVYYYSKQSQLDNLLMVKNVEEKVRKARFKELHKAYRLRHRTEIREKTARNTCNKKSIEELEDYKERLLINLREVNRRLNETKREREFNSPEHC